MDKRGGIKGVGAKRKEEMKGKEWEILYFALDTMTMTMIHILGRRSRHVLSYTYTGLYLFVFSVYSVYSIL